MKREGKNKTGSDASGPRERKSNGWKKTWKSCGISRATRDGNAEAGACSGQVAELRREFYTHLGPWQRAQIARHQQRPYTLDFYQSAFQQILFELHGTAATLTTNHCCGAGEIPRTSGGDHRPSEGRDHETGSIRNFGQPKRKGYRKALRVCSSRRSSAGPLSVDRYAGRVSGSGAEERGKAKRSRGTCARMGAAVPAELRRELHYAQRFPVAFRLRLAKIPDQPLFRVAPLLNGR